MHLPRRVEPHPDESIVGLLARLAFRNGIHNPTWLGSRLGVVGRAADAAARKPFDLGKLAAVTCSSQEALRKLTYWPLDRGGTKPSFNGRAIEPTLLKVRHRRYCPACLATSGHHRMAWDVVLLPACLEHQVWLRSTCPSCGSEPDWTASEFLRCRCGADLRRAALVPVGDHDLSGIMAVAALLGAAPATAPPLPAILERLETDDTITLLLQVTSFASDDPRAVLVRDVAQNPVCLASRLARGVEICSGWPGSLDRYLDQVRAAASTAAVKRHQQFGMEAAFGPFWVWVSRLPAESALTQLLLEAMGSYAAGQPGLQTRSTSIRRRSSSMPVSLGAAAKRLRSSPDRLRGLLAEVGGIVRQQLPGTGAPNQVSAALVASIAADMADLLNQRQLCGELGCTMRITPLVVASGRLPEASGLAAALKGRSWRRSEVRQFVAALQDGAQQVRGSKVPFGRAVTMLRHRGVGGIEAVTMLLDGRAPVALTTRRSKLGEVLFDEAAVIRLAQTAGDGGGCSAEEAARRMGLADFVVRDLCRRGLIATEQVRMIGRLRPRVPFGEITRFQRTYATGKELERPRPGWPGFAAKRLIRMGLVPVIGPSVDGAKQYVFRREDVEEFRLRQASGRMAP